MRQVRRYGCVGFGFREVLGPRLALGGYGWGPAYSWRVYPGHVHVAIEPKTRKVKPA